MPEPPPKKGNPLARKVGPLPLYGWLLLVAGLAVAWVLFRKPKVQANVGTSSGSSPDLSAQGAPPSASADNSGTTADLLAALGSQNSDLTNALLQQQQQFFGAYGDLASTAFAQVGDFASGYGGSFNTQTQPNYSNIPYTNGPDVTYTAPVGGGYGSITALAPPGAYIVRSSAAPSRSDRSIASKLIAKQSAQQIRGAQ